MTQKIGRYLVYVLLCLFPLGTLARINVATNVHIVPQDIVVIAIAVVVVISFLKNPRGIFVGKFFKLQVLFLGIGIASLAVNCIYQKDIQYLVSLLYVIRYLLYLNLINVVVFFNDFTSLRKYLIGSGGAFVIIGLIQYSFFNDLKPLFHLGWDDHLYRLFSTFLDPNFAGVYYVLFFLFLIMQVIYRPLGRSIVPLSFSFFSFIAIFLTYSRSALVALFVAIITYGIVTRRYRLLVVGVLISLVLVFLLSNIKVEGLNPFRTASTNERIKSVNDTLRIIKDNSLIGVGMNAFRYAQIRYGMRNTIGASKSNADAGTDNSYLFVLATTGIIGFVPFLASYWYLVNLKVEADKNRRAILLTMFAAYFSGSFFINVLFYTPILVWFFIFLSSYKTRDYK